GSMSAALYGVLALGDLNNDGKLDAALLNNAANVAVLLNTCAEMSSSAPAISAVLAAGSIVLTWPTSAAGFAPEFTSALGSAWQMVTNAPVTSNDGFQLVLPTSDAARFFRLRR